MYWALIAVKGTEKEYTFFKENEELKTKAQEQNITVVSTLDHIDPNDTAVLKPLHDFLRYYYPFYAKADEYQRFNNDLTHAIVSNFGNPDYMEFFFEELKIVGQDGPYAIVFTGSSLAIKYLGEGPWNNYGLCQYLRNNELVPPHEWEQDPESATSEKSDTLIRHYLKTPHEESTDDEPDAGVDDDVTGASPSDSNSSTESGFLGNIFHTVFSKSLNYSSDEETDSPHDALQQIEDALGYIESEVSQEAVELLELIRNQQMQKGFQDLISVILKAAPELSNVSESRPRPNLFLPSVKISSGYQIMFPFGELELEPLHKALYLLFLRVPDGISLYTISEYKDTLLHLYLEVSPAENLEKMRYSISRLVDRHNNSLYEKISRINAILKTELSHHGADYAAYSILGKRGQPKRVLAARDLIIWNA